ncbi:helix-turn-helix transcriptional regulator [Nocardioides sambongensis]|uniref:helix-turn-helix transcriptional regulator n=1 Tax=Nocardioides sambongensis TaxID=2589074 RepID=UPI0015E85874|nr:LuxR C-terminal-related transcriptional regulator [Nocardioides sambongensis]
MEPDGPAGRDVPDGPEERDETEEPEPAVVVSDQALLAEAIAAGLSSCGLAAVPLAWPPARAEVDAVPGRRPAVGVALFESDRSDVLGHVREVVAAVGDLRWIVLTAVPAGPLWGAYLEAGATAVLARSSSLDEVAQAVRAAAVGIEPPGVDVAGWRGAWSRVHDEQRAIHVTLASLTPSEREVLDLLFLGRSVPEVAEVRGVTVSTVRHQVRSVLLKLDVTSQLAAVARYAALREIAEDDAGRT